MDDYTDDYAAITTSSADNAQSLLEYAIKYRSVCAKPMCYWFLIIIILDKIKLVTALILVIAPFLNPLN